MFLIRQSFQLIVPLRIWIKSSRQVEQMVSGICCFGSHTDRHADMVAAPFVLTASHSHSSSFSEHTWCRQLHPQNKQNKKIAV